jgi:hypothetical protein
MDWEVPGDDANNKTEWRVALNGLLLVVLFDDLLLELQIKKCAQPCEAGGDFALGELYLRASGTMEGTDSGRGEAKGTERRGEKEVVATYRLALFLCQ